jgi:hypothetical protein
MLPFTTYSIPHAAEGKTGLSGKWLWFIVDKPPLASDTDLMQKISAALKADFTDDTYCFTVDSGNEMPLSDISDSSPKIIISFGIPPSSLGIWIDLQNQGMRVLESYTFILTLPLNALSGNANAKKELWKSMLNFMDR